MAGRGRTAAAAAAAASRCCSRCELWQAAGSCRRASLVRRAQAAGSTALLLAGRGRAGCLGRRSGGLHRLDLLRCLRRCWERQQGARAQHRRVGSVSARPYRVAAKLAAAGLRGRQQGCTEGEPFEPPMPAPPLPAPPDHPHCVRGRGPERASFSAPGTARSAARLGACARRRPSHGLRAREPAVLVQSGAAACWRRGQLLSRRATLRPAGLQITDLFEPLGKPF